MRGWLVVSAFAMVGAAVQAQSLQPTSLPTNVPAGTPYNQTSPFVLQNASGTLTATFTVTAGALPPGLTLGTGALLTGTPTTSGNFNFTITGTQSGGVITAFQQYTITILPDLLPNTVSLSDATVGTPYSQPITVAGLSGSFTWSLLGAKPPGLDLSPTTGVISGTPTAASTYGFSIEATGSGKTVSRLYNLKVNASQLNITTIGPFTGVAGTTYTAANPLTTLQAAGGTGSTYSWSGVSTPAGLTATAGGTIIGSIGAPGTVSFAAQVINGGVTATATIAITISAATIPLSITSTSLPPAALGTTYTDANPLATLQITGGIGPYTFGVAAGTFPAGMRLSVTAPGAIAGTPTAAGTANITFRVTDNLGATATKDLVLTVNAASTGLSFVTATLPSAILGTVYADANPLATLQATGGTSPYTFGIAVGTFPAGLRFSTTTPAAIVGTPTASGTSTITFRVTDSLGVTATKDLVLTVSAAQTVTLSLSNPNPTAGQQPSASLTLGSATATAVTGAFTLTFVPAAGLIDDPLIRFSNGTRTQSFAISQGATSFSPGIQFATGTVAGIITLRATLADANGRDITPSPAPSSTITLNSTPPVITAARIISGTGVITVSVTGFSSTRDIQTITFHFVPTTGTTLAQTDIPVDVRSAFTTWYASTPSAAFGSQFTVSVPFTFSGASFPVVAMTVDMTNSIGTSTRFGPVNP